MNIWQTLALYSVPEMSFFSQIMIFLFGYGFITLAQRYNEFVREEWLADINWPFVGIFACFGLEVIAVGGFILVEDIGYTFILLLFTAMNFIAATSYARFALKRYRDQKLSELTKQHEKNWLDTMRGDK